MRAVIRAKLQPEGEFRELWSREHTEGTSDKRAEYEIEVRKIFEAMGFECINVSDQETKEILESLKPQDSGYAARSLTNEAASRVPSTEPQGLDADAYATVKAIINDIPEELRYRECQNIILLGYSIAQAPFLVTAVNPNDLTIRIKASLFGITERVCKDILDRAWKLRKNRRRSLIPFRRKMGSHIDINEIIEVLEPRQRNPTIRGEVIRSSRNELLRTSRKEVYLGVTFFLLSLVLLTFTPTLAIGLERPANWFAGVLRTIINPTIAPNYTVQYIQGTLERTYSALFVTSIVSFSGLLTKLFEISRDKPIRWIMDIERR